MGVGRYISSRVAPSVTPYIYFSAHVCGAQYTLGMLQDTYLAIYLYHCHNHPDQPGLLRYVAARACSWLSQKAHASFPSLQVVNLYADDCYHQDDHHDLPMFSANLKNVFSSPGAKRGDWRKRFDRKSSSLSSSSVQIIIIVMIMLTKKCESLSASPSTW